MNIEALFEVKVQGQGELNAVADSFQRVGTAAAGSVSGIEGNIAALKAAAAADGVAANDLQLLEQMWRQSAATANQWTDAQQRQAMAMSKTHDEALKMNQAFDQTKGGMEGVTGELLKMVGLGAAAAGGFALVTAGLEALKEVSIGALESFGKLNDLLITQAKTGMSINLAEALNQTQGVFGMSAEGVSNAFAVMDQRIESGAKGAVDALEKLRLSANQLREASADEKMALLARAFQDAADRGEQLDVVAKNLFGRGGLGMLPELTKDADEFRAKIQETGPELEEAAKAARQWKEDTTLLAEAWEKVERAIGGALAGMLQGGKAAMEAAMYGFNPASKEEQKQIAADRFTGPQIPADEAEKRAALAALDVTVTTTIAKIEAADKAGDEAAKRAYAAWMKAAEGSRQAWDKFYDDMDKRAIQAAATIEDNLKKRMAPGRALAVESSTADAAAAAWKQAGALRELDMVIDESKGYWTKYKDVVDQELDNATKSVSKFALTASKKLSGLADIFGAIGGALQAMGFAADSAVSKLANLGQSLSSGLAVLTDPTASPFTKIAAGIGMVGEIFGAIKSLFSKPEFKKVMEDVGKEWGVAISEGLAKAIAATEAKDNVSRRMAELLNLSGIMEESGLDPSAFADKIGDLMNAVALGAVPAKEGIDQLGKAFADLQKAAAGGSVAAQAAMIDMIKRARELGQTIPGMDAAIRQGLKDAVSGLEEFFAGLKPGKGGTSAAQSAASQQIFGATFQGQTAELGLIGAAQAMQKAFEAMVASLPKGTKLEGAAADAALMMKLLENEQFKGAASAAEGLAKALKGLTNSANLSQATLDAFGTSTKTLYDQALAGAKQQGLSDKAAEPGGISAAEKAALQAILPMLKQLQDAKALGGKLTPEEEKMLADAQKAGILPLKDVATQQLETLRRIAAGVERIPGVGAGGGGTGAGTGAGGGAGPRPPGLQGGSGGFVNWGSGTPVVLHGIEAVVRPGDLGKGGSSVNMNSQINVKVDGSVNDPAALAQFAALLTAVTSQNTNGAMSALQGAVAGAGAP